MSLKNNTVVITGGSKGIGEGCATIFHREGARVALLDIDENEGKALARKLGERAMFVKCDVASAAQVQSAMNRVADEFGSIDFLINNAGIMHYASVTNTAEEDWDRVMDVNVKGPYLCSKFAIPYMQKAGSGVVVNLGSIQSFVTQEEGAAYSTSKTALLGLTRSIAIDYAPHIRCVAICPGVIDTPLNEKAFNASPDPDQVRRDSIDLHLVRRMGEKEEIGELAAFLCSDKGSFINGQPIRIDGGIGIRIIGSKTPES
ncbi:MAG: glucose 1-dehydrogenase [Balneolaceae bacterium]